MLILADCRFSGGTSSALAAELGALAPTGLRIGLVHVPVARFRPDSPLNPALLDAWRSGLAGRVEVNESVAAELVVVHNPRAFDHRPLPPMAIRTGKRILVGHHPLQNGHGRLNYDPWTVARYLEGGLGGAVVWAPISALCRQDMADVGLTMPVLRDDWRNIIADSDWGGPRARPLGQTIFVGRHSRPELEKWPPTRPELFAVYPPDDEEVRVRLLGVDERLEALTGGWPRGWEVFRFNEVAPRDFVQTIDFFIYFHHPRWVEAFGRCTAEAIASGVVALLPPYMRTNFGDAAVYCTPNEAVATARRMHADPELYAELSCRGREIIAREYGPERHRSLVHRLLGAPADMAGFVEQRRPGLRTLRTHVTLRLQSAGTQLQDAAKRRHKIRKRVRDSVRRRSKPLWKGLRKAGKRLSRGADWRPDPPDPSCPSPRATSAPAGQRWVETKAMRYDLDLFRRLNDEYRSKPLVPSPRSYDAESVSTWGQKRAGSLVERFGIEGRRVLEIGCGRGEVIEALARDHGCEAVGVEVTAYPDWWSNRTGARLELIDLAVEDGAHLGKFDFIFSSAVWEHVEHPFSLLKATKTLLKEDGRFYLHANLFRGPQASHLYRDVFFPWPHLLFADEIFEDYYVSQGLPRKRPTWVNHLSAADYMRYFDLLGFDVDGLWYSITPIDEEFYQRFEEKLSRYPRFDLGRDFLHAVLKHRDWMLTMSTAKPEAHSTPVNALTEASPPRPPADYRRDRIAQAYLGLWGSPETQARARRRIHWMAKQALGPNVLDVGCSEGILGVLLAREGFEVTGIDVNADAIAYANDLRSREHEAAAQRLRFLVSDIMAPPKAFEPFNTVFLGEVLEHVCQPQILLERIHELLRSDGRLVITTPFGYFPHPDHKQEFRASQLAAHVSTYFDVESLAIRDGYVHVVARHRGGLREGAPTIEPDAVLREVEEAAIELQRQHCALDSRLVEAEREIRKLQERLREAEKRLDARHRDYAVAVTELGFVRRQNDELARTVKESTVKAGPTKRQQGTLKKQKERRSAVIRAVRWTLLKAPKRLLERTRRSRAARQPSPGSPGMTA